MPIYDFRCMSCGHEFEEFLPGTVEEPRLQMPMCCDRCSSFAEHIRKIGPAGIHGISRGPGSGRNEMNFNRPDALKEAQITAKRMEETGHFKKHPQQAAQVQAMIDNFKNQPEAARKADYDKEGHPLD